MKTNDQTHRRGQIHPFQWPVGYDQLATRDIIAASDIET